jgi:hypothetical protein
MGPQRDGFFVVGEEPCFVVGLTCKYSAAHWGKIVCLFEALSGSPILMKSPPAASIAPSQEVPERLSR